MLQFQGPLPKYYTTRTQKNPRRCSSFELRLPHLLGQSASPTPFGAECVSHTSWGRVRLPHLLGQSASPTPPIAECVSHTSWGRVRLPHLMGHSHEDGRWNESNIDLFSIQLTWMAPNFRSMSEAVVSSGNTRCCTGQVWARKCTNTQFLEI